MDWINSALFWRRFRLALGVGFALAVLVFIFHFFLMGMVSGVIGTAAPVAHFFESLVKVADFVVDLPEHGALFHVAFFWGIAFAMFTFVMTFLIALLRTD